MGRQVVVLQGTSIIMMSLLLAILVIVAASHAADHEAPPLPAGWQSFSPVTLDKNADINLALHVEERDSAITALKSRALAVNDPGSSHYGDFLTTQEIFNMTVDGTAVVQVKDWLASKDITVTGVVGSCIEVTLSLRQAEAVFMTEFTTLVSKEFGQAVVRAGAYRVPEDIENHVAAIFGLHSLPLPPQPKRGSPLPPAPSP